METLSNWGMGSRTLSAFRTVVAAGGDTSIAAEKFVHSVERATQVSDDAGLVALGAVPTAVAEAVAVITGSDDWTL